MHALYNSLQQTLSLLSLPCLRQSLLDNGSAFSASRPRLLVILDWSSARSQSYVMAHCQPAILSWCEGSIWGPRPDFITDSCRFVDVGCLLWRKDGPRQRSHSRVRFPQDTWPYFPLSDPPPPNLEGQVPYLYPPGRGWPCYTPRHCVPFLSPPAIRREILETASTLGY
jgi:hypothetical protein